MAITRENLDMVTNILRRYGATRVVIFGSALESPAEARDLDLAVDGIQGWDLYRAGAEAERVLGIHLDLIPLAPPSRFTRYIERKGRVLYAS
jgi:predicted nucleotidyltransferase